MGKDKPEKPPSDDGKPEASVPEDAGAGAPSRQVAPDVVRSLPGDDIDRPAQSEGRPVLSLILAVALAITVYFAVQAVGGLVPQAVTIGLSILSLAGLIALFGTLAGFVHFGRTPRQKAFFDKLLDAIGEPCVVSDTRGAIIYSNEPYQRLVSGAGQSRLVNLETLYSGYPDVSERIYRLAKAAREGRESSEQFRLSAGSAAAGAREDKAVWLRLQVKPIRVSATQSYSVWRLSDETDARASQEEAFENLQYIINYLDHAPAGFFSSTDDGAIAYVNATLAEWLGLDLSETTDGRLKLADIVTEKGAKLLAGIAPEAGRPVTEIFDLDLSTANGEIIPARVVHRCEYDGNGKQQPSRTLVLDRRAHFAVDKEAGDAQVQIARLFNSLPIGIAQLNKDGVIEQLNPSFIDIAPSAKRRGKLAPLVREDEREKVSRLIADASAGKTLGEAADVHFTGKDETSGELYFVADETGGEGAVMVFAVDTTRHTSLEVQLAQSQKMQAVGQLAGGVAHDFNNVLTAIIGFSDLLLARHRPTDPSFADIMNIKQNANRAANLVRQLLAFSRRQTLRPEVLSLTDVLSDLGNLLGRLLGEVVELKIVHGRELALVKVDVNQFEQVVINLCVNARDAMPDGGTLTLTTSNVTAADVAKHAGKTAAVPPGDYVALEVTDTGTGMTPEVLEKIYDPFFSTKEVGKGTGLGLSTVYGIIKQTGGFIFCESEVGKGTTFHVFLPQYIETAEEEAARTAAATGVEVKAADLTGSGTILLVEDEDAVRSFAKRALESRGYTVLEADSGEVALEVLEEFGGEPDLVVSDVVMPEMDGPTMLRELRKRGIKTKVVFVSGYAEDAFEKNLEGQTDFAFLPKPFTLKQLAEAVKEAIG
jgi:two-component system cell cycle sensor histidine kinase/response regulator CckA